MPVQKSRLSRAEESTHHDYLRQMQAEGIDVEISEEWEENSRALDVVLAGPAESMVFESATGGVCYAVLARLGVERSGVILTEPDLSTDYDQQIVAESFDDGARVCKLGGQFYSQHEVLNSRIEKNLVLRCGQIVEGFLLATGLSPIPPEYGNSAVVPFRLSFLDQFGDEIGAQRGTLSVLRMPRLGGRTMRKGSGLYGLDSTGKPPELS